MRRDWRWGALWPPFEIAKGHSAMRDYTMIAIAVVALIALGGCGRSGAKSGIIRSTGECPSRDGRFVAVITIDHGNLVNYVIMDKSKTVLAAGKAGNSFMKFYMMWDESDNFWIDSEDTSRVVLCHGSVFESHDWTPDDDKAGSTFPKIPKEFMESK